MLDEIKDDRTFRMIVEFELDYMKRKYENITWIKFQQSMK